MVNNKLLLGQFLPKFNGTKEDLIHIICSVVDNYATALNVLKREGSVFVPMEQVEEFCIYAVEHNMKCSATLITKDGCVLINKTK